MTDLIDRQSVVDIAMCYCPDDDGSCSKANVDIRELLDEIENMPSVNRWISVEYALPEKDNFYITYAETTKYCNHNEIPEELRINVLFFNGEEWYDEECRYYNVMHWMPLPDPPEKIGDDDHA